MKTATASALLMVVGMTVTHIGVARADRYGACPDIGTATRTYTPNIQSFLDYSNRHGLGWTDAQIRRELIAAAEEWTISGENDIRIEISLGTTGLLGSDVNDGINVISICDPDNDVCPDGGFPGNYACGGLGPYRCNAGESLEGDIILYDRESANCSKWRLLHELEAIGSASRSVYRTVLHEMGHNLGFAHYTGSDYAIMVAGAGPTNDWAKLTLQHGEIGEFAAAGTRRSAPIEFFTGTDARPPVWTSHSGNFGTTHAGVGLLQHSYNASFQVFFARNADGAMAVDPGPNALTAYRFDPNLGTWGHVLVQSLEIVRGQPVMALDDPSGEHVIAWRTHNGRLRSSRTVGSPNVWTTGTISGWTFQTMGLAYLQSTGRLYLLQSNGTPYASPAYARRLLYRASSDGGQTWSTPAYGPAGMLLSGVGFSCLNDGVGGDLPCTVTYARQSAGGRVMWRPVGPDPLNPDRLVFGAESTVSTTFDYTSRTPATTSGRAGPGNWRNVISFDLNLNTPFTNHSIRAVSSTGATFPSRSFAVASPHNTILNASYRMAGEPTIAHFDGWNIFYMLYIRDY